MPLRTVWITAACMMPVLGCAMKPAGDRDQVDIEELALVAHRS